MCGPKSGCRPVSWGGYWRKVPVPCFVRRWYCRTSRVTVSMLPDPLASRRPGTLDEIEHAVAIAEGAPSREAAAEAARPSTAAEAVTLPAALAWLRRRLAWARSILATVVTSLPERFAGCAPTMTAMRARLGTSSALVALREICAERLASLPAPLGLVPRPRGGREGRRGHPQQVGRAPPDRWREPRGAP